MQRAGSGGFTLIELMVVIALILIMYAMMYGPAQKSYQDKKLVLCQKNLQTIRSVGHDDRRALGVAMRAETPPLA